MSRSMLPPVLNKLLQERWLSGPRAAAHQLIQRYGLPDEASPARLVWFHNYQNAPWKRTELVNERVPHRFPANHEDFLAQYVDMRIDPMLAGQLIAFDGSILIDRTKGELGARCGDEVGNFIALNLAWQILSGQLDWQTARRLYAETVLKSMHPHLRQGLLFTPIPNQGDADQNWVFVAQQTSPAPGRLAQQTSPAPGRLAQQTSPLPLAPAQLLQAPPQVQQAVPQLPPTLQQALSPQQQSQHAALQALNQQQGATPHPVQRRRAEDEAAQQQGTAGRRVYGR